MSTSTRSVSVSTCASGIGGGGARRRLSGKKASFPVFGYHQHPVGAEGSSPSMLWPQSWPHCTPLREEGANKRPPPPTGPKAPPELATRCQAPGFLVPQPDCELSSGPLGAPSCSLSTPAPSTYPWRGTPCRKYQFGFSLLNGHCPISASVLFSNSKLLLLWGSILVDRSWGLDPPLILV